MSAWVYILQDKSGRFYVGSTSDLVRRMKQHAAGHTPTTVRMCDPVLVFSQEYDTLKIARHIESRLKRLKRKDYLQRIISEGYIRIVV